MNRLKVQMVDTGRLVRIGLSSAVVTSVIQVLTLHVQPGARSVSGRSFNGNENQNRPQIHFFTVGIMRRLSYGLITIESMQL